MKLTPISESELTALVSKHPDLPGDYVSFLATRGWGELNSGVQLYSGPIAPEDIFGNRANCLTDALLIGDDCAGMSFAFAPSQNWCIIAIDSLDMETHQTSASFTEFLSKYHADDDGTAGFI